MPKMLPNNETVLLIPAIMRGSTPYLLSTSGGQTSMFSPSKTVLSSWISRRALPNAAQPLAGGNISAAIQDNMTLGLTSSSRSSSRSITSVGRGERLTTLNFQANLTIFRDADPDANGTFNLARHSTRVQGIPYILAHRLGRRFDAAATSGEDWSLYFVETGQPVPGYANEEDQTINLTFVPKNLAHINQAIA